MARPPRFRGIDDGEELAHILPTILGELGKPLGLADHDLMMGSIEQVSMPEVGEGVGEGLPGRPDHLGQLLLGHAVLDEGAP